MSSPPLSTAVRLPPLIIPETPPRSPANTFSSCTPTGSSPSDRLRLPPSKLHLTIPQSPAHPMQGHALDSRGRLADRILFNPPPITSPCERVAPEQPPTVHLLTPDSDPHELRNRVEQFKRNQGLLSPQSPLSRLAHTPQTAETSDARAQMDAGAIMHWYRHAPAPQWTSSPQWTPSSAQEALAHSHVLLSQVDHRQYVVPMTDLRFNALFDRYFLDEAHREFPLFLQDNGWTAEELQTLDRAYEDHGAAGARTCLIEQARQKDLTRIVSWLSFATSPLAKQMDLMEKGLAIN